MHTMTSYHCIHPNPFQGSQGLVMQVRTNQLSQQGAKRIYFPLDQVVRGYDPLDMVSFWPLEKDSQQYEVPSIKPPVSNANYFLVYPTRFLKSLHACHTSRCITGIPLTGCLLFFAVYFSTMNPESSTEASIKALQAQNAQFQAQNAQFQELIKGLAQGQQELKTMLLKKTKKKRWNSTVNQLNLRDVLSHAIRSKWFNWILEIIT